MVSAPAERYARLQTEEVAAVAAASERLWRRMAPGDLDGSWRRTKPQLMRVVLTGQRRAGLRVDGGFESILTAAGDAGAAVPVARVNPGSMLGWAGDGRPVESLLDLAPIETKNLIAAGATPVEALREVETFVEQSTATVVADTARHSESLSMGVRPQVTGWVRMIEPGACSRCVVLAGKEYRKNDGFLRHPACRCTHIPAVESIDGDRLLDPQAYFDSLSTAEQNRVFTEAGAEAIRNGADLGQVVNARRGMSTAQIGGREVLITREGTTRRGLAFDALSTRGTTTQVEGTAIRHTRTGAQTRQVRTTRAARPRLMPETISQVATDQADYLRLLKANGYVL